MTKIGLNLNAQSSSPKIAKLAIAVSLAMAGTSASAVGISWGDWEGSFDSTITVGASWRVENQNPALIGCGKPTDNAATATPNCSFGTARNVPPGYGSGYSHNGDDGNLNFHKGDSFSEVIKGIHEFGLQHSGGTGFFLRGAWLYDYKIEKGDFRYYQEFSPEARDVHGKDVRMLDAYIYHTWQFEESALQVRFGEQVVNWGESTFIQHSISEANPIDVTKLRVPGAELKEAFIPVQSIWASYDLSPTVTLEAYMQFEWEPIRIDEPGTYFQTADFAGDSGHYIWLGFARTPEFYPLVATGAVRIDDRKARDDDQFGVKLGWYSEALGDTEFGFYYINYHNKRPVISANYFDPVAAAADPLGTGVTGFFEYIEDIQMLGTSFNTATTGGLSIGGEVSYRMDEPLQIDDAELLFAAVDGLSVPVGTSQIPLNNPAFGEEISGYRLFDTIQGQVTLTNLFGPGMGADQWVGLMEIGFNQIQDMPDESVLRFEAPGTSRSGNQDRDDIVAGVSTGLEGVETNNFATDFSWGYRIAVRAEYTGVFGAWNMTPRLVFQHDVKGYTPAPISNFVEGRKAFALGFAFDYLQEWKLDIGYNVFSGGGTQNTLSDRDFVAFNASYSF